LPDVHVPRRDLRVDRWRHLPGFLYSMVWMAAALLLDVRWSFAIGVVGVGWLMIQRRRRLTSLDALAMVACAAGLLLMQLRPVLSDSGAGRIVAWVLLALVVILLSGAAWYLIDSVLVVRRELREMRDGLRARSPD